MLIFNERNDKCDFNWNGRVYTIISITFYPQFPEIFSPNSIITDFMDLV